MGSTGVFGASSYGGLEAGCQTDEGTEPLYGAPLLSAATALEVSYAGQYDAEVRAWVNDEFSQEVAARAEEDASITLFDLYVDVYLNVPGSHTSLYNAAEAGDITAVQLAEFLSPIQ